MQPSDNLSIPSIAAADDRPIDAVAGCELCATEGGVLLWSDRDWRVVRVPDEDFPAFYRLISNRHVREMSALAASSRHRCMDLACAIELTLLERLRPAKMNLATFGNMVPHLHWHVIARFEWDRCFPAPIWASPRRSVEPPARSRLGVSLVMLDADVRAALVAASQAPMTSA